jgi:hypothetical protein
LILRQETFSKRKREKADNVAEEGKNEERFQMMTEHSVTAVARRRGGIQLVGITMKVYRAIIYWLSVISIFVYVLCK